MYVPETSSSYKGYRMKMLHHSNYFEIIERNGNKRKVEMPKDREIYPYDYFKEIIDGELDGLEDFLKTVLEEG